MVVEKVVLTPITKNVEHLIEKFPFPVKPVETKDGLRLEADFESNKIRRIVSVDISTPTRINELHHLPLGSLFFHPFMTYELVPFPKRLRGFQTLYTAGLYSNKDGGFTIIYKVEIINSRKGNEYFVSSLQYKIANGSIKEVEVSVSKVPDMLGIFKDYKKVIQGVLSGFIEKQVGTFPDEVFHLLKMARDIIISNYKNFNMSMAVKFVLDKKLISVIFDTHVIIIENFDPNIDWRIRKSIQKIVSERIAKIKQKVEK